MKTTGTGSSGGRPMIMARGSVVSSGHYLATQVGMDILRRGGNAFDAAAGVGFALTVTKPHQNGIAGEIPGVLYSANEKKVYALSGHGPAPKAATLEHFLSLGLSTIPGDGFLPAIVPPMFASYVFLLERLGTMRLADVLSPAIELAEQGFPMYDALRDAIAGQTERFRTEWPTSAAVFMPGGQVPELGQIWRQPDWARTFKAVLAAEAKHADRRAGLRAAADYFYRGPVAERIVAFQKTAIKDASGRAHAGLLTLEDLAAYQPRLEEPAATTYKNLTVYKCGPWTQGPVLLQTLNLLESFDLAGMGHNSAEYIHTIIEAMKLAYADREFYYGDGDFATVPLARLLSKEYAAARRGLIDPQRASDMLRPGDLPAIKAANVTDVNAAFARAANAARHGDTTKLEVVDSAGNMISITTSGGWLMSCPVVEGLGFPLGGRAQMFSLQAGHPNCVAPGKRPRSTLTPSLALIDGRPGMTFGSPGGDAQDQWALQFLLNVLHFGMNLQEAVDAPTFWTAHFPSSFYPRAAEPASLYLEGRIPPAVRDALAALGHQIKVQPDFSGGNTLATMIDPAGGVRFAAASPRLVPATAAGW